MGKEISVGSQVLWIDEKGQGPAEIAKVTKILLDGKQPSAYEVERTDDRPAAVFRACDVVLLDGNAPPGLVTFLEKLQAFNSVGPLNLNNPSLAALKKKTGLEELEEFSAETEKTGKPPFVIDVKLPAEMASMDPQKIMGTKFLSPDRQEVGLVGQVDSSGVAKILVRPDKEDFVRKLIASGGLPEASISGGQK